jgi:hypothetical protein
MLKSLVPISLLSLLVLSGCSKPYDPNLPNKLSLEANHPLGCVLASISRDSTVEPHFRIYEFLFKSRDSGLDRMSVFYRADYGVFTDPKDDHFYTDFTDGDFQGIVYARNIPVGNYVVDKARFIGLSLQFEAAKDQSQPFEIKKGACTYIGEFRVTPVPAKGLAGHMSLESAKVEIVDSWQRDQKILEKIYPDLVHSAVIQSVLKPGREVPNASRAANPSAG